MTILGIKDVQWEFMDCNGGVLDLAVEAGSDVDNICCQLVSLTRLPTRVVPKLHTRGGNNKGGIII